MGMKSVLAEELSRISLSREEVLVLEGVARDFVKSLKREGVRAVVGGSLAKGTLIRKNVPFENASLKNGVALRTLSLKNEKIF